MAAAAASKWALVATPAMRIVGDVLAGPLTSKTPASLYVSPSQPGPQSRGMRLQPSMVETGAQVCAAYGAAHGSADGSSWK
ncbi:hypothetical protein PF003_g7729 [Phytophthora fragariae]|nr:hypothetical protein PF003_g7729 [Phytophthora fragariae]